MDSNGATGVSGFRCRMCGKAYKRPEHLQRHYASHRPDRPYQCQRCQSSFQRSDVLNRHMRTCSEKQSKLRSNARVACEACRKSKKACNATQPCSNCEQKGLVCVPHSPEHPVVANDSIANYSHPNDWQDATDMFDYTDMLISSKWIDDSGESSVDMINLGLPPEKSSQQDWCVSGKDMLPLGFLENFTRSPSLVSSFDCGTEEQRALALMTFRSRLIAQPTPDDLLLLKSHEIVALVKEMIAVKPRNSPVSLSWSPLLENMCIQFFSPQQIRLNLELYFAIWHPNVNFMHRATFDPIKAKPVLVAAMCVHGARVSSDDTHRENAAVWLTCVEEMVFQDYDLCDDKKSGETFPTIERIQSLQAAYIVVLFQNWDGNEATKRRIRRFRYSTLVAVVRDIGVKHARHHSYTSLPFGSFNWSDFAAREQLIRLALWIFMLDTAFAIFNNMPPRIAIKEMKMHLPFSERCFQAGSRELCWQHIVADTNPGHHLLSSVAEGLCRAPLNPTSQAVLADSGPLTLFALGHALHSMIFQAQHTLSYEAQLVPLQTALDNWLSIWQLYSSRYESHEKHCPLGRTIITPDNMWMRNGFSRYAFDYWLLAKLMVGRISAEIGRRKLAAAHSLLDLSSGGDLIESGPSVILEDYDETSMQQVNELISDFQKVML